MDPIDRLLITVRPTQKFADWMNTVFKEDRRKETHESIKDKGGCYLIGEIDSSDTGSIRRHLEDYWEDIAAAEFEAWWTVEDDWPSLTSIDDFEIYFDWEFRDLIFDLCDDQPLIDYDIDN
jgi:hypothetical protein